jgi:hypothetical protein
MFGTTLTQILVVHKYMKKTWPAFHLTLVAFVFLFLIVSPQLSSATNSDTIAELPAKSASEIGSNQIFPRISFEKTVFGLGDIGQGTKNECEFRFTNTGQGLLKIGKISRTCGCTVFQLDKKEYAPLWRYKRT